VVNVFDLKIKTWSQPSWLQRQHCPNLPTQQIVQCVFLDNFCQNFKAYYNGGTAVVIAATVGLATS
jgi:hypothetical protein